MTNKIVVLSTCATQTEAESLARLLVERRLAACVNIISQVKSYYHWQGRLDSAEEFLLIIKSARERFDELRAALERAHSYEVPEVIALPIVDGAPNYLNWIAATLEAGER
ncbi:MAG: divalent-cation tolerance protein CutA [Acidobacteriia bacterium]|nr:divalent-cation tolerance protein CutA [Terriglobia bacterium]